jgi:hypothetical protein
MIFAYIDPGSGSMVFQMLIAAALAVPFFLREQISRAVGRLRGRDSSSTDQEPSKGNG